MGLYLVEDWCVSPNRICYQFRNDIGLSRAVFLLSLLSLSSSLIYNKNDANQALGILRLHQIWSVCVFSAILSIRCFVSRLQTISLNTQISEKRPKGTSYMASMRKHSGGRGSGSPLSHETIWNVHLYHTNINFIFSIIIT
jgi:hypothetical protein